MTKILLKNATAGLVLGLGIQAGYGMESFEENARSAKPHDFMYGHYMDYSEELDARLSIRYENNKVNSYR